MDRSDRLSLSSQAPLCNEDRQITWRDVKVDGIFSFFFILTYLLVSCPGNSAHRADPSAHPGHHTDRHPLRLQQCPPADGGGQGFGGGGALPPRGGGKPEHEALDEYQELGGGSLNSEENRYSKINAQQY